jgi:hypothetical protein
MKHSFKIFAVALLAVGICGCGGGDKEKEKETSSSAPTTQNDVAETETFTIPGNPQDSVAAFLNAMQSGDETVAEAMLTTKAREETKRHGLAVQPPGTPSAKYEVGRVEFPEEGAAYVHCLWSETHEDQSEETYEVVWVLLGEKEGWRIAGIAMQLVEGADPTFLNFENPEEMMETVRLVEAAGQQPTQSANAGATSETSIR